MSTGELFIIFLAVFILFGPNKIPEIAKGLAKGIQKIRNATEGITSEVNKTIDPIKKELQIHADKLKEDLEIKNDERPAEKKPGESSSDQNKNLVG
jgi:sec-independent protein translocase protein TatB